MSPGGDPLDGLPLELLMALRDALADPSETGRERAAARARDAGFHLELSADRRSAVPMEPAPPGVDAVELRFDQPASTRSTS